MRMYVRPSKSCTEDIVARLGANPNAPQKILLVGSRGGGKSTELRKILGELSQREFSVVLLDLDALGISPGSVSAFDLLYLCGLALLPLTEEKERAGLMDRLLLAYAGNSTRAQELGNQTELLKSLAGAFERAGQVATAAGADAVFPGAAFIIGNVLGTQLRLLAQDQAFISEKSSQGAGMLEACEAICHAVRRHPKQGTKQICLLVDGLEKMNGQSGERFRLVFESTRLLAAPSWRAVIAAPPCTLTQTSHVTDHGYKVLTVWGFVGAGDQDKLIQLLENRLEEGQLRVGQHITRAHLQTMAEKSGGLPRRAIQLAYETFQAAFAADAPSVDDELLTRGIQVLTEDLTRGLDLGSLKLLARVHRTKALPEASEAGASLFANGRIVARPGSFSGPEFFVHPLLWPAVEHFINKPPPPDDEPLFQRDQRAPRSHRDRRVRHRGLPPAPR
jgi:hypothetical protein